jgi:hypothetical protein
MREAFNCHGTSVGSFKINCCWLVMSTFVVSVDALLLL